MSQRRGRAWLSFGIRAWYLSRGTLAGRGSHRCSWWGSSGFRRRHTPQGHFFTDQESRCRRHAVTAQLRSSTCFVAPAFKRCIYTRHDAGPLPCHRPVSLSSTPKHRPSCPCTTSLAPTLHMAPSKLTITTGSKNHGRSTPNSNLLTCPTANGPPRQSTRLLDGSQQISEMATRAW